MNKEYKYSFKNQLKTMASMTVYRSGHQQCSPNFHRGLEIRDFYLIHFVINGCGTYILNGKKHIVKENQAFIIYPSMQVDYIADFHTPWEYCWVGFNGNDARLLMNASGFSPQNPVITPNNPDNIKALIMNIYSCRGHQIHEIIQMTSKLYELIAFLIKDSDSEIPVQSQISIKHVQKACDYIASNYQKQMNITDIAEHIGICRSRLYKIFMTHLSISPTQYLTEFRMREACNMLKNVSKSIKEVAFSVGFNNPLYFSTVFKKYTEYTPREYKKINRPDCIVNNS